MTSNLGSELILSADSQERVQKEIQELLKQSFKPEFLNRIDETVIFNRLGRGEIGKIVDIQLERLGKRLLERKISLAVTDEAKEILAERGFDPQFGARPLKREIQQDLENPLAKAIISGKVREGALVTADKGPDGEIVFS
jgi:ATP-dependent Clp protease ATP-binding subunit ClpB